MGAACSECGRSLTADARFCAFCGATAAAELTDSTEMIKLVTVLFADVVGSTAQAETMHPEDTRALMASFFDAMSSEIRAEGGTVERIIGDAIMADFGVPISREDDPIRAVRVGLRMLERLQKFNLDREESFRIQIRIGINTGVVSTGGSFGEQLLVMGDAVNVAARLQQAAAPGTVVIGERTARAARDHFRLRELAPVTAKGKSEPVAAFVVEGEFPAFESAGVHSHIPLIGRRAEMKKLQDVFSSSSLEGSPYLVTVVGDPGVGKSRLTREFLGWVEPRSTILFGRCLPYGDGATFWPLREILRQEADLLTTDASEEAAGKLERFANSVAATDSEEERRVLVDACFSTIGLTSRASSTGPRDTFRHLLEGWRLLLTCYAEEQPLVMVIEDIHWADATLLEVLDHLVRQVAGAVMFICTSRPDLLDSHPEWVAAIPNYSSVHLEPLDVAESIRLMSLFLELDEVPDGLRKTILGRAEGNPFFLEEILNRLIDEGYFGLRAGRWELVRDIAEVDIPDNVQAAILARLDLLTPEDRRVLQYASVSGRTFWDGLLMHLTGEDDLKRSLATLIRRNLIAERPRSSIQGDREFAFKHVLTRDVAYESLPRKSRGRAHAGVAEWIERIRASGVAEVADVLTHHYDRAYQALGADACRGKARSYAIVAARNAVSRFAVHEAESLGRRAVDLSEDQVERVEALDSLAEIYHVGGKSEFAWAAYMDALEESSGSQQIDPSTIARICANAAIIPTRQWGAVEQSPPDEDIERTIDRGMAAVRDPAGRDRCLLLVSKAFLDAERDRPDDARGAADEAVQLAESVGNADLLSAALDALSATHMHPYGRYAQVRQITQRRLELVPRLSDLSEVCDVYGMAAVSETLIGSYRDAVRSATNSAEIGRQLELGAYLHALNWRVHARFMAGDWDGALEDEATIERLEDRDTFGSPGAYSARSAAAMLFCLELRGHPDAHARLQVMRNYRNESERAINVMPLAARALAHMGSAEEGWNWIDLSRRVYRAAHLEAACELALAQQDWARARDIVEESRAEASACGLLALGFFADRLEGVRTASQADPTEGQLLLHRSATGFADLGAPWEEACSRLLLAECLSSGSDEERSRAEASEAARVFQRLRSVRELSRARELLVSG